MSPNINKTMCVYNVINCPSTKFMCASSTISFVYIFINYGIKINITIKVFFIIFF